MWKGVGSQNPESIPVSIWLTRLLKVSVISSDWVPNKVLLLAGDMREEWPRFVLGCGRRGIEVGVLVPGLRHCRPKAFFRAVGRGFSLCLGASPVAFEGRCVCVGESVC